MAIFPLRKDEKPKASKVKGPATTKLPEVPPSSVGNWKAPTKADYEKMTPPAKAMNWHIHHDSKANEAKPGTPEYAAHKASADYYWNTHKKLTEEGEKKSKSKPKTNALGALSPDHPKYYHQEQAPISVGSWKAPDQKNYNEMSPAQKAHSWHTFHSEKAKEVESGSSAEQGHLAMAQEHYKNFQELNKVKHPKSSKPKKKAEQPHKFNYDYQPPDHSTDEDIDNYLGYDPKSKALAWHVYHSNKAETNPGSVHEVEAKKHKQNVHFFHAQKATKEAQDKGYLEKPKANPDNTYSPQEFDYHQAPPGTEMDEEWSGKSLADRASAWVQHHEQAAQDEEEPDVASHHQEEADKHNENYLYHKQKEEKNQGNAKPVKPVNDIEGWEPPNPFDYGEPPPHVDPKHYQQWGQMTKVSSWMNYHNQQAENMKGDSSLSHKAAANQHAGNLANLVVHHDQAEKGLQTIGTKKQPFHFDYNDKGPPGLGPQNKVEYETGSPYVKAKMWAKHHEQYQRNDDAKQHWANAQFFAANPEAGKKPLSEKDFVAQTAVHKEKKQKKAKETDSPPPFWGGGDYHDWHKLPAKEKKAEWEKHNSKVKATAAAAEGDNFDFDNPEHQWIKYLPNPMPKYKTAPEGYGSGYEKLSPTEKIKAWKSFTPAAYESEHADHMENWKHLQENPPGVPGQPGGGKFKFDQSGLPHQDVDYSYAPKNDKVKTLADQKAMGEIYGKVDNAHKALMHAMATDDEDEKAKHEANFRHMNGEAAEAAPSGQQHILEQSIPHPRDATDYQFHPNDEADATVTSNHEYAGLPQSEKALTWAQAASDQAHQTSDTATKKALLEEAKRHAQNASHYEKQEGARMVMPHPKWLDQYKNAPPFYGNAKPYGSLSLPQKAQVWANHIHHAAETSPDLGMKEKWEQMAKEHEQNAKHFGQVTGTNEPKQAEAPSATPLYSPASQKVAMSGTPPATLEQAKQLGSLYTDYATNPPSKKAQLWAAWTQLHLKNLKETGGSSDTINHYEFALQAHHENAKLLEADEGWFPTSQGGVGSGIPKPAQAPVENAHEKAVREMPWLAHKDLALTYVNTPHASIASPEEWAKMPISQRAERLATRMYESNHGGYKKHWANAIRAWKHENGVLNEVKQFPKEMMHHPEHAGYLERPPTHFPGNDADWNRFRVSERLQSWAENFIEKNLPNLAVEMLDDSKRAKKWEEANGVPKISDEFQPKNAVDDQSLPRPWHYAYPPPRAQMTMEQWNKLPPVKKIRTWLQMDDQQQANGREWHLGHLANYNHQLGMDKKNKEEAHWEKIDKKYGHAPNDILPNKHVNYREAPKGVDQKFWEKQPLSARAEYMADFSTIIPEENYKTKTSGSMGNVEPLIKLHKANAAAALKWEEEHKKAPKGKKIKDEISALPFPEKGEVYATMPAPTEESKAGWKTKSLKEKAKAWAVAAAQKIREDEEVQQNPESLAMMLDVMRQHMANAGMLTHVSAQTDKQTMEMFPGENKNDPSTFLAQHPHHPNFVQPNMVKQFSPQFWHAMTDKQKKAYHDLLMHQGKIASDSYQPEGFSYDTHSQDNNWAGHSSHGSYFAKDNPSHPHYLPPDSSQEWDEYNALSDREKAQKWTSAGHNHTEMDSDDSSMPPAEDVQGKDTFAAKNPNHPHFLQPKGSNLPGLLWHELPDKEKARIWEAEEATGVAPQQNQPIGAQKLINGGYTHASKNGYHENHDEPDWYGGGEWEDLSDNQKDEAIAEHENDDNQYEEEDNDENDENEGQTNYYEGGRDPGYNESNRPSGKVGSRIYDQIQKQIEEKGEAHEPQFSRGDDTVTRHLDRGTAAPENLYRAWKWSSHTPGAYFLKYLVNRANNIRAYDDPKKAEILDKKFETTNQIGASGTRPNLHTLHEWARRNPEIVSDLIAHKRALNHLILQGIGLNVRTINGQPYVALARGIGSEVMKQEHDLSAFADDPESWGASYKFPAWVPLKDVWYSYDMGPSHVHSGAHGNENEYLVGNTGVRYKAEKKDVTSQQLGSDNAILTKTPEDPKSFAKTKGLHPAMSTKTKDADLGKSIQPGVTAKIMRHAAGHDNAGEHTYNALMQHVPVKQWSEWVPSASNMTKEMAKSALDKIEKAAKVEDDKGNDVFREWQAARSFLDAPAFSNNIGEVKEIYDHLSAMADRVFRDNHQAAQMKNELAVLVANKYMNDEQLNKEMLSHLTPYIESRMGKENSGSMDQLAHEMLKEAPAEKIPGYINKLVNEDGGISEAAAIKLLANKNITRPDAERLGAAVRKGYADDQSLWQGNPSLTRHMPVKDTEIAELLANNDNYDIRQVLSSNKWLTPEQMMAMGSKLEWNDRAIDALKDNPAIRYHPGVAKKLVDHLFLAVQQQGLSPSKLSDVAARLIDRMPSDDVKDMLPIFAEHNRQPLTSDYYTARKIGQNPKVALKDIMEQWPGGGDQPFHDRVLKAYHQAEEAQKGDDDQAFVEPVEAFNNIINELSENGSPTQDGDKAAIEMNVLGMLAGKVNAMADDKAREIQNKKEEDKVRPLLEKYGWDKPSPMQNDDTSKAAFKSMPLAVKLTVWKHYYDQQGEAEKAAQVAKAKQKWVDWNDPTDLDDDSRVSDTGPEDETKVNREHHEEEQHRKLMEKGHIIQLLPKEYRKMLEEWLDLQKTDAIAFTLKQLDGGPDLNRVQLPIIDDQLGFSAHAAEAFKAARFLACGKEPIRLDHMERLLWEADGDFEAAALAAYGLEITDENRKVLRAVAAMQPGEVAKAEADQVHLVTPRFASTGQEVCDSINAALGLGNLADVVLGRGKHNSGSRVANDVEGGKMWLLKPNAGGTSSAAGVAEEQASQATREAAFYRAAEVFGLQYWIPRAECVLMGDTEYAAIKLLDNHWLNCGRVMHDDPNEPERIFNAHLNSGLLHRWAVLDFVLGNPDRHSANLMILGNNVQLIDQGSAFAGNSFDPAHDKKSFVPFYLRAKARKWSKLTPEERLFSMPVPSVQTDYSIRAWLDALNEHVLGAILVEHGINPQPVLARLQRVRALPGLAICLGINKLWIE